MCLLKVNQLESFWNYHYFQTIKFEERLVLILIAVTLIKKLFIFLNVCPIFVGLSLIFCWFKKYENTFWINGQSCTLVWNAKYEIRILNGF